MLPMGEQLLVLERFINWFQTNDAFFDHTALKLDAIPGQGNGAIALRDLPKGHVLFSIPRSLTLSTRTSILPSLLGDAWIKFRLEQGWTGLILCMMWESAQGLQSKWCNYIASLPTTFDTPMFWDAKDLEELIGTSVLEKMGKEDAENDYREKLLPSVKSRPDLFPPDSIVQHYSLEQYHIMGSRILSRSFTVERWEDEENEATDESMEIDTNTGKVGEDSSSQDEIGTKEDNGGVGDRGDSEDDDDSSATAMVPMADMLNARYGSENAKLFHEENVLNMVTTTSIAAGSQIYNTYGDLPNSELLRRYGHVDMLPLSQGREGNPGDAVEIRADIVVDAVPLALIGESYRKDRIDWWLDEGGDDVFTLEADMKIPDSLVAFVNLLTRTQEDWNKLKSTGKMPKPKCDATIVGIIQDTLRKRLGLYPTTMQADEELLKEADALSLNKRHAVIVRLGEKRILTGTLELLNAMNEGQTSKRKIGGSAADSSDTQRTGASTKKSRRGG